MWLKKLVEDGKYKIGDTITCYLEELKNMPGKKTDNGVFKTEDESIININVPTWFKLTPGKYYDIYLKGYHNGFVQWDYREVDRFREVSDDPNDYEEVIKLLESGSDDAHDLVDAGISHRVFADWLDKEIDVTYHRLKMLEYIRGELL